MAGSVEVSEETFRERRLALANMLASRPERHNQGSWGYAEPENECGTTACAAGWAMLASDGLVQIGMDGVMSWRPEDMVDDGDGGRTLWRVGTGDLAQRKGRKWLGLSNAVATALFLWTDRIAGGNAAAVEFLLWLADGRVDAGDREFGFEDFAVFLEGIGHPDVGQFLRVHGS